MHLEFTPDGKQIMAIFGDVGFWSVETGRLLFRLEPEGAKRSLSFARLSPDASHILCLNSSGEAFLFVAKAEGSYLKLDHHTRKVTHGSFSPDGSFVLLGSEDRTASVWKVSDGSLIQVLTGHKGEINQTAFSPDGNWMATVSDDYTTRLWPVKALKR
ncbi:MAG TPA: hypothetical protein EYQ50_06845 [Verrucomicrobiales bacterium]|nr:hypothetical protein [Verrucomicrobiales bacterium]